MKREILWSLWNAPGLEHLRLLPSQKGPVAEGQIITTLFEERPLRLSYLVQCDAQSRVREVRVIAESASTAVRIRADGEGHWTTDGGDALPMLDGCIDVDIMATPFTNTLPIRRLGLRTGQAAEITVAYVKVPTLDVVAMPQRYTCLESRPDGGLYRYESLDTGYTNELTVDADGLVLNYPGIWKRVWPPKADA
ncbi:MAG: putative glycolipid-binding domain-containing protein [Thermomicrobiales bacterium]